MKMNEENDEIEIIEISDYIPYIDDKIEGVYAIDFKRKTPVSVDIAIRTLEKLRSEYTQSMMQLNGNGAIPPERAVKNVCSLLVREVIAKKVEMINPERFNEYISADSSKKRRMRRDIMRNIKMPKSTIDIRTTLHEVIGLIQRPNIKRKSLDALNRWDFKKVSEILNLGEVDKSKIISDIDAVINALF